MLRVVAKDLSAAMGFDHVVVCSTCGAPVGVGPLHVERVKAGAPIICSDCLNPNRIRYEDRYRGEGKA